MNIDLNAVLLEVTDRLFDGDWHAVDAALWWPSLREKILVDCSQGVPRLVAA